MLQSVSLNFFLVLVMYLETWGIESTLFYVSVPLFNGRVMGPPYHPLLSLHHHIRCNLDSESLEESEIFKTSIFTFSPQHILSHTYFPNYTAFIGDCQMLISQ